MGNKRLYSLAKELGIDSKELIVKLRSKGVMVKSALSSIDKLVEDAARRVVLGDAAVVTPPVKASDKKEKVVAKVDRKEPVSVKAPHQKGIPKAEASVVKVQDSSQGAKRLKKSEGKKVKGKKTEVKKAEAKKPEVNKPEVKKPEVKKPEVKKPEVKQPVKVDNDFDSFGGFDDEEPAKTSTEKPAVKSSEPTKVDPKKPTGEGNDEFEGFMDFDEGFVPLDKTSDVAMGSRVPSFSERIAAEFKRQGISEGVAAPPVRSVTKQDSPVNHQSFATSLKSELAEGLPSDRELLPEEHSTIIASLLDFSDNGDSDPREANDASKAEKPSYSGNGKIQQLLNQLNSFK